MRLTLSACPPFSLRAVIESHGWIRLPPFSADPQNGMLIRVERLETGRVVELQIGEAQEGVSVETRGRLAGSEREEVGRKVWWMLGLGQDLLPFYDLARGEPKLQHAERRTLGRLLRSSTVFEDAVKVILTTNTSWGGTIRMVEGLLAQYGDTLSTDPSRNAFPTPAQIAATTEDDLREVGLGYRAPFVLDLARATAEGKVDLELFKDSDASTEHMRRELIAIKGVGEYASASILMLLGRYDYLPIDSWAFKLVSHEWYEGEPVGPKEVKQAFEKWGTWKGLAYWFWDWSLQS